MYYIDYDFKQSINVLDRYKNLSPASVKPYVGFDFTTRSRIDFLGDTSNTDWYNIKYKFSFKQNSTETVSLKKVYEAKEYHVFLSCFLSEVCLEPVLIIKTKTPTVWVYDKKEQKKTNNVSFETIEPYYLRDFLSHRGDNVKHSVDLENLSAFMASYDFFTSKFFDLGDTYFSFYETFLSTNAIDRLTELYTIKALSTPE